MSSHQPTKATATAGRLAAAIRPALAGICHAAMTAAVPATAMIASPPPRGVARAWIRRWWGRSIMPRCDVQSMR